MVLEVHTEMVVAHTCTKADALPYQFSQEEGKMGTAEIPSLVGKAKGLLALHHILNRCTR